MAVRVHPVKFSGEKRHPLALLANLSGVRQRSLATGCAGDNEMTEILTPELCIIGGGSGGLAVATKAAAFGVPVILVERGKLGGDGLNQSCVPSKALLAAARRAHHMRDAAKFGIRPVEPDIDHKAVAGHVHSVIAGLAPQHTVERLSALGVQVIRAEARFVDRSTLEAGGRQIKARRFVIATGSTPLIPPIPGLDRVPYYTNETVFDNNRRFAHLLVIGAGAVGLELAQAHRRLGSDVTVIDAEKALGRDDPELSAHVVKRLKDEGIRILENARIERIEPFGANIQIVFATQGKSYAIEGTNLLIAAGRNPALNALNLDAAGIRYDARGIIVGRGLKTSNRRVHAVGDATGLMNLTHVADYHASIVVKNALFRLPAKADHGKIPWVTFTDPELAHVGLTESEARERHGKLQILRWPYSENDRAHAERETEGFLKVIATPRGKILGAGMVGLQAGELIQLWSLAMQKNIPLRAMADFISPYPTLAEINKRAAMMSFAALPQNIFLRRLIGWLGKLG